MAEEAQGQFVTSDLSLAAYLCAQGFRVMKADGSRRNGHYEFRLDDPDDRADKLARAWVTSCCQRMNEQIRNLKTLLQSGRVPTA